MRFDTTTTQITTDNNTATPETGAGKKSYTRPVLTKCGKVTRLTAAISGSNTDTFGGNQFG